MADARAISDHWGKGDVFARILDAMERARINPETVTIEQLAPVDHFHARGFPATVELADGCCQTKSHKSQMTLPMLSSAHAEAAPFNQSGVAVRLEVESAGETAFVVEVV